MSSNTSFPFFVNFASKLLFRHIYIYIYIYVCPLPNIAKLNELKFCIKSFATVHRRRAKILSSLALKSVWLNAYWRHYTLQNNENVLNHKLYTETVFIDQICRTTKLVSRIFVLIKILLQPFLVSPIASKY